MLSAVSTLSAASVNATWGHSTATGCFRSVEDRFIENWGHLAEGFGMEEGVGKVHAVLYLASAPLGGAAIAEHLDIDEETCCEHLDTLVSFGIVHERGEEAGEQVFEAERDPWSWFMLTVRERARREFSPLVASIRAVNTLAQEAKSAPHVRGDRQRIARIERIGHFSHFVDQVSGLLEMFSNLGAGPLVATMRMAAKFMPRG